MTTLIHRGKRVEVGRHADKRLEAEEHAVVNQTLGEEDPGDSKDIRLTLMEEILLLGLKDKEVGSDWISHLRGPFLFIVIDLCHLFS